MAAYNTSYFCIIIVFQLRAGLLQKKDPPQYPLVVKKCRIKRKKNTKKKTPKMENRTSKSKTP